MSVSTRERILGSLAKAVSARPWWFVIGGLAAALAALGYAQHSLEFKSSRHDLLGHEGECFHLLENYTQEFDGEDDLVIVVEGDSPVRNREAVDALAAALVAREGGPSTSTAGGEIRFQSADVFYRLDFDALRPRLLYFLSVEELDTIRKSVREARPLLAIMQNKPRLDTFLDVMTAMVTRIDAMDETRRRQMEAFLPTLSRIITRMAEFRPDADSWGTVSPWFGALISPALTGDAAAQVRWRGYNVFRDGRLFVMTIRPSFSPASGKAESQAAVIAGVRHAIEKVRRRFPQQRISLTGEPVLGHDEMNTARNDTERAMWLTVILVGALFSWSFREMLRPLLAVVATLVVVALSLGLATLTVGHLNIITVTMAVMIVGLGMDLGIQLIARYEEELAIHSDRKRAARAAIEQAGPAISTAGMANAAAFFAMCLSGFHGVKELGVVAGCGLLAATLTMLTVLPAVLIAIHRRQEATHLPPAQAVAAQVERQLLRWPGVTLTLCAAITAGAVWTAPRVGVDYNVLNLQSLGLEAVETQMRLLRADARATIYAAVICDDLESARGLQKKLELQPKVAGVVSLVSLMPERQAEKAVIIRDIQRELGAVRFRYDRSQPPEAGNVLRLLNELRLRSRRLLNNGNNRESDHAVIANFAGEMNRDWEALHSADAKDLAPRLLGYQGQLFHELEDLLKLVEQQRTDYTMTVEEVPPEARRLLLGHTGKLLLRVFPRDNIWEREPLTEFVREVRTATPQGTGVPMELYEFVDQLLKGYRDAALWALLAVAVLVFLDFRNWRATALALLPVLVGMAWMFGAMAKLGIQLNPANIMVLPLLVGIGVAYGIYIVQRYREDRCAEFCCKSTGRAVGVNALVTIIAFGSLILGAHRGIRSLGLLMTLGVAACAAAALVLLPALLELARRKEWKI